MLRAFSSKVKGLRSTPAAVAFLVLLAISSIVRLFAVIHFPPQTSYDTGSYVHAAHALGKLHLKAYNGFRTPAYPLLLLLGGMNFRVARLIQSILGIVIASMLFAITWYRTRSAAASLAVGLLSSLSLSELLFEQIIYSETLCAFWIVLSAFAFARTKAPAGTGIRDYALLGLSAALAGMTRPMFLILGPLYFCFIVAEAQRLDLSMLREARLALVLAPTLAVAIGWSAVNQYASNYFGVTTTTGYDLVSHSGAFIELAPPKYSEIARIYLRYRAPQLRKSGNQAATIWYAGSEIERTTGFSGAEVSKQLTRMSLEMFAAHPILYLDSVTRSWLRFWGIGAYGYLGYFKEPHGRRIFYALVLGMIFLQWGITLTFLLIAAYSIVRWRQRTSFNYELELIAIVLLGSIPEALLINDDNERFFVPLIPLTIYVVVTFLWRAMKPSGARHQQLREVKPTVVEISSH